MNFNAYSRHVSFDDTTLRMMGEEFDRACGNLGTSGISLTVREIIATRIIGAAKSGERNPIRIYQHAMAAVDTNNSIRLVA